jgi:hypothetical protein
MSGKELLPPIYAGIRYLGHGLFLLQQRCPEPEKRFDCAREKILLNNSLIKLKPSVPPGTTFERMIWLGKRADKSADFLADQIPEDALLVFRADKYIGVCDSKGSQILPAEYVWIGNLREEIVALRKSDDLLYTFNFETRKLQKLSYQKVRRDCLLTFNEGLSAFASAPSEGTSLWGFIDTSGNVVIEPKFVFAWNFEGGLACVRFPANGGPAHNELIDKNGKLASPPNLKVIAAFGPYVEVHDPAGNCGVVNRKFEFVIPPKYKYITAQLATPNTVDEIEIRYMPSTKPIRYYAARSEDGKPVILLPKGDAVLELPSGLISQGPTSQPLFADGVSKLGPGMPIAKGAFANLRREIVPAPYSNLSHSKDVRFGQIAPGILLKTIACSQDLREKARYPFGPVRPVGPFSFPPKERTLREYVCDPLQAAVDAFDNGHYEDALLQLQKANLDERRDPIYQPVFIRGLCLQKMGKFEEAATEYATVNKFSNDQLLKNKSQMGLDCCSKKQSAVAPKMLTFPPGWERQGGIDIPIQLRRL